MKAVCTTAVAPRRELADTFEIRDVLDPIPGPDQFRVRVPYTAVNIDDLRIAEGRFLVPGKSIRPSEAKPHVPGHDFVWASTRTASRSPSAVCRAFAPPASPHQDRRRAKESAMKAWFDGTTQIDCDLQTVKSSVADLGTHFVGVVRSMPGISAAELLEHGEDFVTIRTNEGVMKRHNIERSVADDKVILSFDEVYETSKVTVRSHFEDTYTASNSGVVQFQSMVSDVQANGVLGFLYRRFGSRNMGKAFLSSQKKYFENTQR